MGTVSKESPERQRYLKLKAESVKTPNPTVLYEIGQCYANGLGTDKDIHRAFEHFLNSANNGLDIAQVRLGQCYAEGLGIEKDVHKAAEWYKKASEAGNHDAKNALAKLLPAANTIPAIDKYQQAKITPQISIDEEVIETLKDGGMLANSVFKVKSKFRIKIKKVYCSSKEYDRESAVLNDLGHLFSNQYHPEKEFFLECLDQFPTSQTNYFEYCETSLERYFDTTARKLYEGRELFLLTTLKTQIIPALKFLHSQGICHMDIKANNILGKVHDGYYSWKISDFDHSVKIGQEFGEPGYYRAPEVAKGMKLKEKLFAKDCIDIWALGCMIGDLLTNFTFYKEVEQDSLFFDFQVPVNFRGVPNNFSSLLPKLMTKEPKLRVTASELLTAAVFQIQDTKEAAARGNAIANEKLNLLLQQNQAIQTALNSFLPAIQKNLNLLISDAKLPPGKFVILPIKNSFNLTNKFYKKYKLNFICEVEGGYHLVEAKEFGYEMKEFSKLSKGLILGSQILLSLAVAALVPAAGSLVNGAATGIIDILQAASEEVSSEIQSWKLSSSEYSEIEKDSSDAMMEFIKVFLEKNGNSRLGVKKANRVDGTIAWLCEKHYKNEDITVQSYNDSQDRPTADMTANANGDIGDSTAGVIKSEPVLPDKLASPKAVNQSLLDFWDSSETSVKWEEFFSMVIVEMKINKNTCQLDKTSLREACGDFSQALPSLKFSLLKKVVGSEDVKDFFDRYIVNKNEVKTVEWYIKDAERGNLGSQVKLGERYSTGIGVEKNLGKSFFWYLKAAEQGSAISQDQVAICYSSGLGVDKDEKVAFSWFSKAAHQGNSNSQFKLSTCYKYGLGVASDEANSIYWLKKAVERGNSYAQFHLGERYAQGLGVSKDEKRAFELYWKAADQNNSYAQFNLGEIYASGKGVAKDEKRAFELYWKAADQNNSYAQFNLGEIYENGKGVPKDEKRAVKLYTKAGDQNNSYALYNLGECYAHGKGVTKDEQKAIELFMKSAALESSYAQFNLGVRFFHGNGVQQDKEQSKEFLQKALANGHHRAQEILDKF